MIGCSNDAAGGRCLPQLLTSLDSTAAEEHPDPALNRLQEWLAELGDDATFNELAVRDVPGLLAHMPIPSLTALERNLLATLHEHSGAFYGFLKSHKFFGPDGSTNFNRLLSLITQQLHGEECVLCFSRACLTAA